MSGRISVGLSVRSRRRRTAPHEASRCASEHAGVDRQPERRDGAGFRRAREAVPVLAGGEPGGTQRDHLRAGRHPKVASLPAFFGLVLALLALAAPATLEAQVELAPRGGQLWTRDSSCGCVPPFVVEGRHLTE